MLLGRITGKVHTLTFSFIAEAPARKFEFVKVMHKEYGYVLCQIIDLEKEREITEATSQVIGYRDQEGRIKQIRTPFDPGTEVFRAEDEFISAVIELDAKKQGAYIGQLEGRQIPVYLDLNQLLTKHIAVLAKSGSGKSYSVGVLLEEIMDKKIPLLVIDPHGEYASLKYTNDSEKDRKHMPLFGIIPKGFARQIKEYGDESLGLVPLRLKDGFTVTDIMHLLPKLTTAQQGLLFSCASASSEMSLAALQYALEQLDSNLKWGLITLLQQLNANHLFSPEYTSYNQLIQTGVCSIINLKGMPPEIQQIVAYKLLYELFEERKKGTIPPFFTVIEEAHHFAPERSFGEARSSKIIRDIASEGRKFGLGLCIITQRPARVEKSVLSQITTQIILKVTNPNDLKAIANAVEGLTLESEHEISNLPIGTALITGVVDKPLFVNIRPRKTKHGGDAVEMITSPNESQFFEELKEYKEKQLLPIIQTTPIQGVKLKTILVPAYLFLCQDKDQQYNLLLEAVEGMLVVDVQSFATKRLPHLNTLSSQEMRLLEQAYYLTKFTFEQLMKKMGGGFDVKEVLHILTEKGFIHEQNEGYVISEDFALSNLSKYACTKKIEQTQVQYDDKLRKLKPVDALKAHLAKFVPVIDQRECYIMRYASL
ncbi:ATP-binding protein [Candidatus Woesearchaeota archaeon]|nr:ATP-binding protein [Candidatus Woesearchaeota archaeon]